MVAKKSEDFFSRFKKYFDSAVNIVKLKPKTIGKISKDSDATLWGLLFVAFAGVATSFGAINVDSAIVLAAGYIIWTVFFTGILLFLARIFGGKGTFIELFRPRALGSIVYWVGAIPGIGSWLLWLSELWVLVMSVAIIKRVCKLKTAQAIIVVIVPVILVMGIVLIMLAAITAALIAAGALTI